FIPTSTHGPMQLWYGTLQTGPYLASRAYNPRTVFEAATFPYTSLDHVPLLVTARLAACAPSVPRADSLFYWTDRHPPPVRAAVRIDGRSLSAAMEPSPAPTAYYYYFDVATGDTAAPLVYFVS